MCRFSTSRIHLGAAELTEGFFVVWLAVWWKLRFCMQSRLKISLFSFSRRSREAENLRPDWTILSICGKKTTKTLLKINLLKTTWIYYWLENWNHSQQVFYKKKYFCKVYRVPYCQKETAVCFIDFLCVYILRDTLIL